MSESLLAEFRAVPGASAMSAEASLSRKVEQINREYRSMAKELKYPLFLIPLEAGYVSVVEEDPAGDGQEGHPTYHLAIFTGEQVARQFMTDCGIDSEPRALRNAREFAWLLQSLREPVTSVAFDPQSDPERVKAAWKVPVRELLERHVVVDYSPWNYPVFVVRQQYGYASIEGTSSSGAQMRAVAIFTTRERAEAYVSNCGEAGTIRTLPDVRATRDFLERIALDATAVALDVTIDEGRHSAQYCFSIRTLLEKYLVAKQRRVK